MSGKIPEHVELSADPDPVENIMFFIGNDAVKGEILRLDEQGMTYRGLRIEDAGAAHRAFIETMAVMQGSFNKERMGRCGTCRWHEAGDWGECDNDKARETLFNEESCGAYTPADFGCVHWEPKT